MPVHRAVLVTEKDEHGRVELLQTRQQRQAFLAGGRIARVIEIDQRDVEVAHVNGRKHAGVDFKTPVGTPVVAPFDGLVVKRNWNFRFNGNCLDIVDSKTFKLLKRGYATRPMFRNLPADERAARIQGVVDEILRDLRFAP